MIPRCTQAGHEATKATAWASLSNPRPWPDAGLELADCPHCGSTLARELVAAEEVSDAAA